MRSIGVTMLCLLAGCAVGPDYKRPAVDAPQDFRFQDEPGLQRQQQGQPGGQMADMANTAWWAQFRDPTLDELIAIALRENKDVRIAASRIELFLGQYASTRSLLLPQVGADINGRRGRGPAGNSFQAIEPVMNQYEASLSASWELDLFGRRRRETEAAHAQVLASEEGRRATVLTLVSSVATSYIILRELERQLQIARDTTASREKSYLLFKDRFEGGTVSELELAQTKSLWEASLVDIPRIEDLIGRQENALSVLLGRNPGPIRAGQPLEALVLPPVPAGLPSSLLERRPDLRQAEQELIAANALIGAARAQYFPTISLTGLLGYISKDFSNLFNGSTRVWSYGVSASMPIFTGGGIAGQVQQAEAQQREALFRYQKAIQTAFQEVSDALLNHAKSREQMVFQGREVATLRNYVELARLRYDEGYTSYIEVLDAERSLFEAEVAYAQVYSQVYVSLVNLYKAMGGGWVLEAERMAQAGPRPQQQR
jgi:multidrug efflux system outer membrane protein